MEFLALLKGTLLPKSVMATLGARFGEWELGLALFEHITMSQRNIQRISLNEYEIMVNNLLCSIAVGEFG